MAKTSNKTYMSWGKATPAQQSAWLEEMHSRYPHYTSKGELMDLFKYGKVQCIYCTKDLVEAQQPFGTGKDYWRGCKGFYGGRCSSSLPLNDKYLEPLAKALALYNQAIIDQAMKDDQADEIMEEVGAATTHETLRETLKLLRQEHHQMAKFHVAMMERLEKLMGDL